MMTTRHRSVGGGTDTEGDIVGIDPHKKTLSACVIDERGGVLDVAHFRVSGDGHRALEAWVRRHGPAATWGIEGASSLGRHTAVFLIERGTTCVTSAPTAPTSEAGDATRA
ncbi:MAG: transposase [Actinobacteria bacterium]|nr:transposase [Actinomycetota bacterium]